MAARKRQPSKKTKDKPKNKGGRPSLYDPSFIGIAKVATKLGATDREVAEAIGVDEATVKRWMQKHPEFCASVKVGKAEADDRVEQSLYRRATGYTFNSEKLFAPAGSREVLRAPVLEHVPPDPTSMIFWLKNRRPKDWRDKQEVEHSVSDNMAELLKARRKRARGGNA